MFAFNEYGFHIETETFFTNLIVVYDTKAIGKYKNILLEEKKIMYCVIYTLEGEGYIELKDGTKLLLPKNALVFARHADVFALASESECWHFHCFWFTYNGFTLPFNTVFTINSLSEKTQFQFMENILALLKQNTNMSALKADSYFTLKLLEWLEPFDRKSSDHTKNLVQAIIAYIEQNLSTPISIRSLSAHFNYSEKYLRHIFKQQTGTSPKQYILNTKMHHACHFLSTSSISLDELSQILGFSSPYHFSNAFKDQMGCSPSAYRKEKLSLPQKDEP